MQRKIEKLMVNVLLPARGSLAREELLLRFAESRIHENTCWHDLGLLTKLTSAIWGQSYDWPELEELDATWVRRDTPHKSVAMQPARQVAQT